MTETLPIPIAAVNLQPNLSESPYYTPEQRAQIFEVWAAEEAKIQLQAASDMQWENGMRMEATFPSSDLDLLFFKHESSDGKWIGAEINRKSLQHLIRQEIEGLLSSGKLTSVPEITEQQLKSTRLYGLMLKLYPTWQEAIASSYRGAIKPYTFSADLPQKYWKGEKGKERISEAVKFIIESRLFIKKKDPEEFRKALLSLSPNLLPYIGNSIRKLNPIRSEQVIIDAYPELGLKLEDFEVGNYWHRLHNLDEFLSGPDAATETRQRLFHHLRNLTDKTLLLHEEAMRKKISSSNGNGSHEYLQDDESVAQALEGDPEASHYSESEKEEILQIWERLQKKRVQEELKLDEYVAEDKGYIYAHQDRLADLVLMIESGQEVANLVKNKTEAGILVSSMIGHAQKSLGFALKTDEFDEKVLNQLGVLNIIKKFYPHYQVGLSRSLPLTRPYLFKEPLPIDYWKGNEGRKRLGEAIRTVLEDQICLEKVDPETFRKIILSISAETMPFLGPTLKELNPTNPEDALIAAYPELKLRRVDFLPSTFWSEHVNVQINPVSESEKNMLRAEPSMRPNALKTRRTLIEKMKESQEDLIQRRILELREVLDSEGKVSDAIHVGNIVDGVTSEEGRDEQIQLESLDSGLVSADPEAEDSAEQVDSVASEEVRYYSERELTDIYKHWGILTDKKVLELEHKEQQYLKDSQYISKNKERIGRLINALIDGQDITEEVTSEVEARILVGGRLADLRDTLGIAYGSSDIDAKALENLGLLSILNKFYPNYQVGLSHVMRNSAPPYAFKEPLPIGYWKGKGGQERLNEAVRSTVEQVIAIEKLDPEVFRQAVLSLSAVDIPFIGAAIKELHPDFPQDAIIEAYPELKLKRNDFSPGIFWHDHLITGYDPSLDIDTKSTKGQFLRKKILNDLVIVHQRLAQEKAGRSLEVGGLTAGLAISETSMPEAVQTEQLDLSLVNSEHLSTELVTAEVQLNPELEAIIQEALDGRGDDFELDYAKSYDFQTKFKIAEALIRDGRFPHPDFLIENLGPSENVVVTELKNQLIALKIESRLENSPDLKALIDSGVPIEVVTQIAVVEFFTDITDEEKLEELRSRITQPVLREYLGILKGQKQVKDLTTEEKMDMIPDEVFSNPHIVKFGLLERYFEGQLMRMLTDKGISEGMAEFDKLVQESPAGRQEFLATIRDRFLEIATAPAPPGFRSKISVNGELRPFPSFEQNAFLYDFINNNCRFLTAETGLGKSATSFMAMESTDARKVMIIAPAIARETWRIEEEKIFTNPGQVFIVEKAEHLFDPQISEKKYIVISQNLLGTLEGKPEVATRIKELITEQGIEGAIIDEIDSLSNPRAISVKSTFQILDLIRANYALAHDGKEAPVLGLSATPIRKSISDLDAPMSMLYPDLYARSFAASSSSKRTFSQKTLSNPEVVFATLIGERRMFRWENANGVQEFNYASIPIDLSPFERELYEYVLERVPTQSLDKIRILEDLLLNPNLIKAEVRRIQKDGIGEVDFIETLGILKGVAKKWKDHHGVDAPLSEDQMLSIDRLVEMGYTDLAIKSFFTQTYDNGLDYLVELFTRDTDDPDLQTLGRFWKPREISTKYDELRQMVLDGLSPRTEDGQVVREKVFIVSPSRKQGRTKGVQQRTIASENGREKLYTESELDYINDTTLIKRINGWLGTNYGKDAVMLLDGSIPVKARNAIIQRWKSDPNAQVLLVTLESTYQSRDFTIQETVNEYGIKTKGVTKVFLGWPWYHQQFKQMVGRSQRQGQIVPVRNVVLEASGTIDQGKRDQVMYTALLTRLALGGARLTPEEQEFFDERKSSARLIDAGLDSTYMRDSLVTVRAKGEDRAVEFYEARTIRDKEKTNEVKFAEKYFDEGNDQYRVAGQNSQLVAAIASETLPSNARTLSLGAGTLLFQRSLKRPVVNVDINSAMMDVAKHLVEEYGGVNVVGRASRLNESDFVSNSFDFVDSSFALHWSSLGTDVQSSERVKIISQINRVLTLGGKTVITVPDSAFDEETFEKFAATLEINFGFTIDQKFSGKTFAISKAGTRKRLGWGLTLVKKSEVSLQDMNLGDLSFLYDSLYWISHPENGKKKPEKKKDKIEIEAAQIDPERFEIINLDNEKETIVLDGKSVEENVEFPQIVSEIQAPTVTGAVENESVSPQAPVVDSASTNDKVSPQAQIEDYESFLKQDYPSFRRLIRQIQAETELGWDESIEMAIGVLQSLDASGRLASQGSAYAKVISEVKRRSKL